MTTQPDDPFAWLEKEWRPTHFDAAIGSVEKLRSQLPELELLPPDEARARIDAIVHEADSRWPWMNKEVLVSGSSIELEPTEQGTKLTVRRLDEEPGISKGFSIIRRTAADPGEQFELYHLLELPLLRVAGATQYKEAYVKTWVRTPLDELQVRSPDPHAPPDVERLRSMYPDLVEKINKIVESATTPTQQLRQLSSLDLSVISTMHTEDIYELVQFLNGTHILVPNHPYRVQRAGIAEWQNTNNTNERWLTVSNKEGINVSTVGVFTTFTIARRREKRETGLDQVTGYALCTEMIVTDEKGRPAQLNLVLKDRMLVRPLWRPTLRALTNIASQ